MQDTFARARTRPKGPKAKCARDDRVYCIQTENLALSKINIFVLFTFNDNLLTFSHFKIVNISIFILR